jgi:hypothetical protein
MANDSSVFGIKKMKRNRASNSNIFELLMVDGIDEALFLISLFENIGVLYKIS